MAGVGFRLKNYFQTGVDGNQKVKGVLYGVIFSSGPWLMTILGIGLLTLMLNRQLLPNEVVKIKTIWTYSYAVSLLVFGILEMPLTKYLSDKMYDRDLDALNPLYRVLLVIALLITMLISFFMFGPLALSFGGKLACFSFLFSTLMIWISMVYLSAAKNFKAIVVSFLLGSCLGVLSSIGLGEIFPITGHLVGYAFGQMFLMLVLMQIVLAEFPGNRPNWLEVIHFLKSKWYLPFIGSFYYLGIWADKFVFWVFGGGERVEWIYYNHPYYDTALFLSFISVVPAFTFFLIHVETNLFSKIKKFIFGIENDSRLIDLEKDKQEIGASIRNGIFILGAVQLTVSLIGIFYLPVYLDNIKATTLIGPVFRYGLVAAFFQGLFMVVNILLYYFNADKTVLRNYICFFILNFILSLITVGGSLKFHGLGIVMASFFAFLISLKSLNDEFNLFEYKIFVTLNPLNQQKDRMV